MYWIPTGDKGGKERGENVVDRGKGVGVEGLLGYKREVRESVIHRERLTIRKRE